MSFGQGLGAFGQAVGALGAASNTARQFMPNDSNDNDSDLLQLGDRSAWLRERERRLDEHERRLEDLERRLDNGGRLSNNPETRLDQQVAKYAANVLKSEPPSVANVQLWQEIEQNFSSFKYVLENYEQFFTFDDMENYYLFLLGTDTYQGNVVEKNIKRMEFLAENTFSKRMPRKEVLYNFFVNVFLEAAGGAEIAEELAGRSGLARLFGFDSGKGAPQFVRKFAENPGMSASMLREAKNQDLARLKKPERTALFMFLLFVFKNIPSKIELPRELAKKRSSLARALGFENKVPSFVRIAVQNRDIDHKELVTLVEGDLAEMYN